MSVFIVSDERYCQLAREITARIVYDSNFRYALQKLTGASKKQDYDTIFTQVVEEVEILRKANYTSYNQKYKDCVEIVNPLEYQPGGVKTWSDVQLYKTISCLEYQLEGEEVEATKDKLCALMLAMANILVTQSDEYQEAQWG